MNHKKLNPITWYKAKIWVAKLNGDKEAVKNYTEALDNWRRRPEGGFK